MRLIEYFNEDCMAGMAQIQITELISEPKPAQISIQEGTHQ